MNLAEMKKAIEEFRKHELRLKEMGEKAYEQLKSAGVPCDVPCHYRGLAEWIQTRNKNKGLISIEEREDKKFEYFTIHTPKRYDKKIENVMKDLGIEKYVYVPVKR